MTVVAPAYAGLSETLHCPEDWDARVQVIVDRGATVYGPSWEPAVLESLKRMSAVVSDGYTAAAYDHLLKAEQKLGLVPAGAR